MRRLAHSLLVLLAVAGVAGAAPYQGGPVKPGFRVAVPLRDLKPSQMEVGRAEVNEKFGKWEKSARSKGMSLAKFARTKLVTKFKTSGIEAVIDPNGDIRPTDGHHRISSLLEVKKRTGVDVPVQVKIVADYRGQSMETYANDFLDQRGKGYFTRSVSRLPAVERVQKLPDSFAKLTNSPMRSAMAQLFSRLHIDDAKMVDYAEFKVADYLVEHHVFKDLRDAGLVQRGTSHLPQALAKDPRALAVMEQALSTSDGQKFLAGLTRTPAR